MGERSLLLVPIFVLLTTAYVACSGEDVDSPPVRFSVSPDSGPDVGVDGQTSPWPDAAVEDADDEDAPFSGTG